ncbi:hypothetical protein B4125_1632 [Bacillus paralicheniformis]|uniref:Uncharacterized protein n=1 Tax=Bacillus paralicheniformis TaxID=1648923 RepID=A0A7Z0WVJ7_9BACI|nr:hypothetical protein SC10_B2orf03122 [Bacillus paralicheniformis]OLF87957.1 hypothetical protein B4121_4409 [Bacillus paralicheniformis]OLG07451.1 hypothetical protein B4125_1632 [Bacillus paralicheniformis]TWJ45793.1 hypothetical protein CHCC5027_2534 [Bacillus paralicheniformis]TWJ56001.1 hypothetical protein CHCC5022_1129 [Bacillus paralicheniformis]
MWLVADKRRGGFCEIGGKSFSILSIAVMLTIKKIFEASVQ